MTTLFILLTLSLISYFSFKAFRKEPETKKEKIERIVSKIKAEQYKEKKYPLFIPYYEYHAFYNGLDNEKKRNFKKYKADLIAAHSQLEKERNQPGKI
jgi:hypothetical protein